MLKIFITLILSILSFISSKKLTLTSNQRKFEEIRCEKDKNLIDAAKHGNADVDIISSTDIVGLNRAIESSIPISLEALEYVKNMNSPQMYGELASIDSKYSNCMWLQVMHIERAGLGQTFACWAMYLSMSIKLNLTYHSSFYSQAHKVCNLNQTAHFFGLHSTFFWANIPPKDVLYIDVGNAVQEKGCNIITLGLAVKKYKKSLGNKQTCANKVVFRCHNKNEDFQSRYIQTSKGIQNPVRGAFQAAFSRFGNEHIKIPVKKAKQAGNIIVVTHIRRGDVLQSRRIDKDHRLVSFGVYEYMIRKILYTRKNYFEKK